MTKLRKKSKSKKPSRKGRLSHIKRKLIKWFITSAVVAILFASAAIYLIKQDLPNIANILDENKAPVVTIKDSKGIVLAKYGDLHGTPLTYKQIPNNLIEAVVATEDRRFFNHIGIDFLGLMRAIYVNQRAGKVVQGGSTLTQQLAKISLLTPDRTIYRKLQEAILAIEIERKFSKQEIITMYLNRVYLGRGNYGVDAASKFYFGKNVHDINLSEAAMLAGMLKSPNKLSPANDKEASMKRAKQVLYNMEDAGYITIAELQNIAPARIMERGEGRGALHNPYFTDYVMELLPDLVGPVERNLTVYTTLDLDMQNKLEGSLSKVMAEQGAARDVKQGAAVTIDSVGAIKAWVGGTSYRASQFDRVYRAKRQPGSSFKLFVYLAGLENGIKLTDHFVDHPISVGKWRPRNFSREYKGKMTMQEAFAQSINTIAVQISEKVGRQKVADVAHALGITEELQVLPSLALGASEVPLLQMTSAYAGVASRGYKITPIAIVQVLDSRNKVIYSATPAAGPKVLTDATVNGMWSMMRGSVLDGTSKGSAINGVDVYGKTGTSQDHRDAWFFGFANGLTTGVWLGNDDNTPMRRLTGGAMPATLWKRYMMQVIGGSDEANVSASSPAKQSKLFGWLSGKKEKSDTIDQVIEKSKKR